MPVQSLGREDPLEKEMATHSSILAWETPWTEELGGLQSTGLKRLSMHARARAHTHIHTHTHTHTMLQREKMIERSPLNN